MRSAQARFHCSSVAFSPFDENKMAVASAQYFGIVGNGRQSVFAIHGPGLVEAVGFDTQDAAYDCCWSECNNHHLVTACGDGSIKIWDFGAAHNPLRSFEEHSKEASSVSWNLVSKETLLSGSWDSSIKLWDPFSSRSIGTWREHTGSIYGVSWAPHSSTGDRSVKMWDTRAPASAVTFVGHTNEILCLDWNKYRPGVLVSGSADRTLHVWDARRPQGPVIVLHGHKYAVKRCKFSPWSATEILSCSYDLSVALWDTTQQHALVNKLNHHREFVTGVDYSLFTKGLVTSCSWDKSVCLWNLRADPVAR